MDRGGEREGAVHVAARPRGSFPPGPAHVGYGGGSVDRGSREEGAEKRRARFLPCSEGNVQGGAGGDQETLRRGAARGGVQAARAGVADHVHADRVPGSIRRLCSLFPRHQFMHGRGEPGERPDVRRDEPMVQGSRASGAPHGGDPVSPRGARDQTRAGCRAGSPAVGRRPHRLWMSHRGSQV